MAKRFTLKKEITRNTEEVLYYIYDSVSMLYLECFDETDVDIARNMLNYLNGLQLEIDLLEEKLSDSQHYRSKDNIMLGDENKRLLSELKYNAGLANLRKQALLNFVDDLIYENKVVGKHNGLSDVKRLISEIL